MAKQYKKVIGNTRGKSKSVKQKAAAVVPVRESTMMDVKKLVPATYNVRKKFDAAAMAELAASIKKYGIINPLIVREAGKHFEVVCGARRLQAAIDAGLGSVPVTIMQLDDEQAFDLMILENLQRVDVHPMDEARGFKSMMESGRYEAADLAAKFGKSESYIYGRLKLNDLIPEVAELFESGYYSLGHARLFVMQGEKHQRVLHQYASMNATENRATPESVQALKQFLVRMQTRYLNAAKWNLGDELLVEAAGACNSCAYRSCNNKYLFEDLNTQEDMCLRIESFEEKRKAYQEKLLNAEKEKHGKVHLLTSYFFSPQKNLLNQTYYKLAKKGACEHVERGMYFDETNSEFGKAVYICKTKGCKVHWPTTAEEKGNGGKNKAAAADHEYARAVMDLDEEATNYVIKDVFTRIISYEDVEVLPVELLHKSAVSVYAALFEEMQEVVLRGLEECLGKTDGNVPPDATPEEDEMELNEKEVKFFRIVSGIADVVQLINIIGGLLFCRVYDDTNEKDRHTMVDFMDMQPIRETAEAMVKGKRVQLLEAFKAANGREPKAVE